MSTVNTNRLKVFKETAQLHQINLRRNLERRLEAARARGDENLIRLLEAEAEYIG
jgi:hypothetical protein